MVPNHLLSICSSLEVDIEKQVGAGQCLFRLTQGGTGYRFVVPGGRPRTIAWVGFRTRGTRTDKPMRPCGIVCIRGDLLTKGAVVGLLWNPDANYKSQQAGGHGEWHGITYAVGDNGYHAILRGLVAATTESMRRASK